MFSAENLDNKIKEFWPKDGPPTREINKYIKKYSKEKIVIKCGGRVLLEPDLFNNFINDVAILKKDSHPRADWICMKCGCKAKKVIKNKIADL